jgi:TatD DNase family protein
MFIDTHAHITSPRLLEGCEEIISRAENASVSTIINICTDKLSLKHGIDLSEKYDNIFTAAATTPHDVEEDGESFFPSIIYEAQRGSLIAIGETGLDYHYMLSPKELQKEFFVRYLDLALEYDLPLIVHCRDAFDDAFSILDKDPSYAKLKGVFHCFTGTEEEAIEAVARGWYISFSGIITFKSSDTLRKVVQGVPLGKILIETDAPYLAPQSKRGKANEPAYLPEIAQTVANIKNMPLDKVAMALEENTNALFALF